MLPAIAVSPPHSPTCARPAWSLARSFGERLGRRRAGSRSFLRRHGLLEPLVCVRTECGNLSDKAVGWHAVTTVEELDPGAAQFLFLCLCSLVRLTPPVVGADA